MMNEIYDIEEAEEYDEKEGLTHGDNGSQKTHVSGSTFGIVNNMPIPYRGSKQSSCKIQENWEDKMNGNLEEISSNEE